MTDTNSTAPATTAPVVKPGYQSSETWLAFLGQVLGAAVATHLIGPGGAVAVIGGLALTAASTIIHTWGRVTVKTATS